MAESPTLSLPAKVNTLKSQGKRVIEFHIGEPDFTIPPNVSKAIKTALDEGKTYYTHQSGLPELRQAISRYYSNQLDLACNPENIVVTAGPKDTIFKVMATLVNPG